MPKKLLPIKLEDIALYQIPSRPRYSPGGSRLAFEVTRADLEKNEYHTDVYIAEGGAARRVTWSIDASIVLWDDDDTLILRRSLPDAEAGTTELFRLSMSGGEARPWLTLPFSLRKMEKLQDGYIAIPGSGNPEHIAENYDIFDFELSEDEMNRIRGVDEQSRYEHW